MNPEGEPNAMLDPLERELAEMILSTCRVENPPEGDVDPDAPLIGPDSPFGLDSLDAVELVVEAQRRYDVRIDARETSRKVLASLRTFADFIRSRRQR
jgi:acyl carrier protein